MMDVCKRTEGKQNNFIVVTLTMIKKGGLSVMWVAVGFATLPNRPGGGRLVMRSCIMIQAC